MDITILITGEKLLDAAIQGRMRSPHEKHNCEERFSDVFKEYYEISCEISRDQLATDSLESMRSSDWKKEYFSITLADIVHYPNYVNSEAFARVYLTPLRHTLFDIPMNMWLDMLLEQKEMHFD
jgi:hypothetical protein